MLTQQIGDIDNQVAAQNTEAMDLLDPLRYFALQRRVDHLMKIMRALQDEWNNTMNELAACKSSQSAHRRSLENAGRLSQSLDRVADLSATD